MSIPGGGYGFVSVQNEGLAVAQHFNALGTTVFVLVYRLPREGWGTPHLVAIQDAQRAMRFIRARATEFRIDPARLGVLGFSAGGHLASDLVVSHADNLYAPIDAADQHGHGPLPGWPHGRRRHGGRGDRGVRSPDERDRPGARNAGHLGRKPRSRGVDVGKYLIGALEVHSRYIGRRHRGRRLGAGREQQGDGGSCPPVMCRMSHGHEP